MSQAQSPPVQGTGRGVGDSVVVVAWLTAALALGRLVDQYVPGLGKHTSAAPRPGITIRQGVDHSSAGAAISGGADEPEGHLAGLLVVGAMLVGSGTILVAAPRLSRAPVPRAHWGGHAVLAQARSGLGQVTAGGLRGMASVPGRLRVLRVFTQAERPHGCSASCVPPLSPRAAIQAQTEASTECRYPRWAAVNAVGGEKSCVPHAESTPRTAGRDPEAGPVPAVRGNSVRTHAFGPAASAASTAVASASTPTASVRLPPAGMGQTSRTPRFSNCSTPRFSSGGTPGRMAAAAPAGCAVACPTAARRTRATAMGPSTPRGVTGAVSTAVEAIEVALTPRSTEAAPYGAGGARSRVHPPTAAAGRPAPASAQPRARAGATPTAPALARFRPPVGNVANAPWHAAATAATAPSTPRAGVHQVGHQRRPSMPNATRLLPQGPALSACQQASTHAGAASTPRPAGAVASHHPRVPSRAASGQAAVNACGQAFAQVGAAFPPWSAGAAANHHQRVPSGATAGQAQRRFDHGVPKSVVGVALTPRAVSKTVPFVRASAASSGRDVWL